MIAGNSAMSVSAGLTRRLFEFAVAQGADARELARRAGLSPQDFDDFDARIPFDRYAALMRAAKALTGDPALPLHYADAVDMSEFSVVGLLAQASETMAEAFAQLNRYGKLVIEVDLTAEGSRFAMAQRNGGLWLVDQRRNPNDFHELTETTFTRMAVGPRRFLPAPHVLEVHVTHDEPADTAHRAAYDAIFQCPITFNAAWNVMRMEPSLQTHRVQLQPRYVFGIFAEHADALLAQLQASKTVRGRIEALLMPVLHTGEAGMDMVAAKLAVSRQTLYRQLKEEGVTFEQVLDALRCRLATQYLRSRKVSVNETAYLVGFSDPAAFSRAFKRWTGQPPSAAREG
jgi:AraC-like DNA-binding protein